MANTVAAAAKAPVNSIRPRRISTAAGTVRPRPSPGDVARNFSTPSRTSMDRTFEIESNKVNTSMAEPSAATPAAIVTWLGRGGAFDSLMHTFHHATRGRAAFGQSPSGCGRLAGPQGQAFTGLVDIDDHLTAVKQFTGQQHPRQRVPDRALYESPQRAGAVRRVVTGPSQPRVRGVGDRDRDPARSQATVELSDLQVDDVRQLVLRQRVEDHNLVETVEELRLEGRPDHRHHRFALLVLLERRVDQIVRAEVRGQDQKGVPEVDRAAVSVGKAPVVEHL